MHADGARSSPGCARITLHSVSSRIDWKTAVLLFAAVLLFSVLGANHPLLIPGEARHAGIVHDMWAAQQYLMPRIDGLPVLDGAPLHYWVSLFFVELFGASEWVARLPSALAAAVTLVFLVRLWLPRISVGAVVPLVVMFLIQPAVVVASRYASADMFNVMLLALSVGSFLLAVECVEQHRQAGGQILRAWIACALLGLAAGPMAIAVPLIIVFLWLAMRRKARLIRLMCWWPGPLSAAALILPWYVLVADRYPGIVTTILHKQALQLWDGGRHSWAEMGCFGYGLLLFGGLVPLMVCLYRYWDANRRQALRTPVAGLMATWLVVVLFLHPVLAMTAVGPAALVTIPMLYFAFVALMPDAKGWRSRDSWAWALHILVAGVVTSAGVYLAGKQSSTLPTLTSVVGELYRSATDKVILLDRYDYEFNFYMRSPKLVYVVSDWRIGVDASPSWKTELAESAPFAPQTAARMLLTSNDLVQKLCERRVVNLWVIGSEQAASRHPILRDVPIYFGRTDVRVWYLDAESYLPRCAEHHGG